jgi:hypothetical protein
MKVPAYNLRKRTSNRKLQEDSESCHLCRHKFPSREELDSHLERADKMQVAYECDKCPMRFTRVEALVDHFRIVHWACDED